jgi:hypothetical protein
MLYLGAAVDLCAYVGSTCLLTSGQQQSGMRCARHRRWSRHPDLQAQPHAQTTHTCTAHIFSQGTQGQLDDGKQVTRIASHTHDPAW